MLTERTLVSDLDQRIGNSPRFKANSVREYFQNTTLDWWKPTGPAYVFQEHLIGGWLNGQRLHKGLELGPGFGRITKLIAPKVDDLTLVEINRYAVKKLTSRFTSVRILNTAVENFGDWTDKYDLVVAVEILVHIPDVPGLLGAISRSINKGGFLITSITPDDLYRGKHTIIHRGINPDEFENALNQRRLEVSEKVRRVNTLTYLLTKI